jgi:hypothetical protein
LPWRLVEMPSPSTGLALATSWRPAVGARWAASLESIMNTLRTSWGVTVRRLKAGHSRPRTEARK